MCESQQLLVSSRVPGLDHVRRTGHRTPSRGQRGPSVSCSPSLPPYETGAIIINTVYRWEHRGSTMLSDLSEATQPESDQ